ncbi:MAG: hypothetical protein R3E54_09840 [Halioglobus sp.]
MTQALLRTLLVSVALTLVACSDGRDDLGSLDNNVLVFTEHKLPPFVIQDLVDRGDEAAAQRLRGDIAGKPVVIVKLRGKTNHFGRDLQGNYLDYAATVPDTPVWIAEYPWTRGSALPRTRPAGGPCTS